MTAANLGAAHMSESKVKRYEWVRSGMASVEDESPTIPWCAREYFVLASDYDRIVSDLNRRLTEAEAYAQDREEHTATVARGGEIIIGERDTLSLRVAELEGALRLAQSIIGHPDDRLSQYIASVLPKETT